MSESLLTPVLGQRQNFPRHFLTAFAPLMVALVMILLALFVIQTRSVSQQIEKASLDQLNTSLASLASLHDQLGAELSSLADLQSLNAFIADPSPANQASLSADLSAFGQTHPAYQVISLLSPTGVEWLRLERLTAQASLQPGTEFTGLSLQPGIQASSQLAPPASGSSVALQLGEPVVLPSAQPRPVFPLSLPFFSPAGQPIAILQVLISADTLQQALYAAQPPLDSSTYLLDSTGSYLAHPDSSHTFGGLIADRAAYSFLTDQPAAWESLTDSSNGQLYNNAGLFQYALAERLAPAAGDWKLVVFTSQSAFDASANEILRNLMIFVLPLTLLAMAVSAAFGQAWSLRQQADESFHLANQIIENITEGVMITDSNARLLAVNRAFTTITGYTPQEAVGQTPALLKSGHHDDLFYQQLWQDLRVKGRWQGEIWNRHKSGAIYPEWLHISTIKNRQGETAYFVGMFSDISDRKQAEMHLQYLATHDPLTRLANRALFQTQLKHAIAVARRSQQQMAVLIVDLDNLKAINDAYGFATGDLVLQEIANRLRLCVRESDTVARLGGDEYCLVLESLYNRENAIHAVERIISTLAAPFRFDDGERLVSASIGVSIFPEDGEDGETLLRNANAALSRSKSGGKNTFNFFS